MKLAIFAATGGIGWQVLEQAVAAGHDVTAVARNPKKLSGQVRIVTADLAAADPAALESGSSNPRRSSKPSPTNGFKKRLEVPHVHRVRRCHPPGHRR
jgi:NAD(P)-dependent dehydrogenase (short-subunit alcohol dehydrogenase family)